MKCFYHTDNDGFCAGSLVYLYYKTKRPEVRISEEDFIKYNYNKEGIPFDKLIPGEEVIFVDLSFKVKEYETLKYLNDNYDLTWVDHHDSSIDLLKEHPEFNSIKGTRSKEHSGAYLTYMYFWDIQTADDIPHYIKLVSDYDTWKFEYGEPTTHFYLGTNVIENTSCFSQLWSDLFYKPCYVFDVMNKGNVVKTYVDNDNFRYLKSYGFEAVLKGFEDIKCYAVNKISNSWIFGEKYEQYPFVVVFVWDGEKYKYTLYSSNPSINCKDIAEHFDGGGHKGSAGFISSELLLTKVTQ